MAIVHVTPELLSATADQMEKWLKDLRAVASLLQEARPEGFVYEKAPPVSDYLDGLISFTAYVGGQADVELAQKRWGLSAKAKRREKKGNNAGE